jgi:hypothetical protein
MVAKYSRGMRLLHSSAPDAGSEKISGGMDSYPFYIYILSATLL